MPPKKWVSPEAPEEWVRQNFLQYLLQVKDYPAALVSIEKEIRVGEMRKRYDIVVYDRGTQPWLLVECKQTSIVLGRDALDQALRYHIQVPVQDASSLPTGILPMPQGSKRTVN